MIRQYELVERVRSYDPNADEAALNRAYVYSMKAHGAQTRASGDPFFSHPIEVAGILTRYRLDSDSIVTALLHDTVEDTDATLEEIRSLFGDDIAKLVDGVTKLTRIELQSAETSQAENFRKLLLAMSADLRVLLVKLADRLHNMRTLRYIKNPDKRRRIANETLDIYAPLAERIGMRDFQEELQDLAFRELNFEARESILKRLSFLRARGENVVPQILEQLTTTLSENGVASEVTGREKAPYSIWRKMEVKEVEFEQLSDIMAFRVVVADIEDCYRALGIFHGSYPVVPGRFKDFISLPKPNGYQSLHTTVIGPDGQRIEIQIRTKEMHEVAEVGVAAHWKYKQVDGGPDGRQYRWVRELLDIMEHASDPEEFLEHTKLEMFQDQVFCFTPRGDLLSLPHDATLVDFAYAVHSEVGDRCVGAKVNGRIVPLRTVLKNGDQVEIITSKSGTPSPEWDRFVVTGKARGRVRRYIRMQQRDEYLALGKAILDKTFREAGKHFRRRSLDRVLRGFGVALVDDLIASVGAGVHTGPEVFYAAFPELKPKQERKKKPQTAHKAPRLKGAGKTKSKSKGNGKAEDAAVNLRGLIPGMAVHFAGCCHPLPGDRIVGIVTTGKGVTIHTLDCDTLASFADMPERWLDVDWDIAAKSTDIPQVGRLQVLLANEPGSLGDLSTVIGKNEGNISNLKITNRSEDFFEMMIDIQVRDVRHLTNIMAALRASPMINSVKRARG